MNIKKDKGIIKINLLYIVKGLNSVKIYFCNFEIVKL